MKFKKLNLIDIFLIICLACVVFCIRIENSPILLPDYQSNKQINFFSKLEMSKVQSFILIDFFSYRIFMDDLQVKLIFKLYTY